MFKKLTLFNILLVLAFVAAISIHFLWLDRFPVGMTHDELEYVLSSRTYWTLGQDLSGFSFPITLFRTQTEGVISALPAYLLSPYYGNVVLNQLMVRLPYIFISIFTAITLYFFVLELLKNKKIGLIASFLFLISPWGFYLSRFAADSPWALFFYLLGTLLLLKVNGKYLVFPLILFSLGFFSYHGAKPLFPFLILATVFYRKFADTGKKLQTGKLFIIIAFVGLFLTSYILIDHFVPGSILSLRSKDIFFLDQSQISQVVDLQRKQSIDNPFASIFSNKFTVSLKILSEKYLTAFSPQVLFLSGDLRATYRFGDHGLLYITDLIFIIIGTLSLYVTKRRIFYYLLFLIAISPIASALSGVETSFINRSFFLLPLITTVTAIGVYQSYRKLSVYINSLVAVFLVGLIIGVTAANFFYFYFFRFPVTSGENYFLGERVLTNYLFFYPATTSSEVITAYPRNVYFYTIFNMNKNDQDKILKGNALEYRNGIYQIKQTTFTRNCFNQPKQGVSYIISRDNGGCFDKISWQVSIQDQKDAGDIYRISNDLVCNNILKNKYRRTNLLSDYTIEKMNVQEFCNRWIAGK